MTGASVSTSIQLCVVTQDSTLLEATRIAAEKAGLTFTTMRCCATCHVPCKPIVAVDVANPDSVNSVSLAKNKNGGLVLIAIAPECMTSKEAKEQGYQFVVYRSLIERFLPTMLRIGASLLS